MSCSNAFKNVVSDLLRTAEADSQWTPKAARKFLFSKVIIPHAYISDALRVLCTSFKGRKVCKENTHAKYSSCERELQYLPCPDTEGQNYCMS